MAQIRNKFIESILLEILNKDEVTDLEYSDFEIFFNKKNKEELDTQYQRDRKAEYDKLNQDEMRFDDLKNGTNTWEQAIDAIKNKFPKPSES